jgi:hypothetical protein
VALVAVLLALGVPRRLERFASISFPGLGCCRGSASFSGARPGRRDEARAGSSGAVAKLGVGVARQARLRRARRRRLARRACGPSASDRRNRLYLPPASGPLRSANASGYRSGCWAGPPSAPSRCTHSAPGRPIRLPTGLLVPLGIGVFAGAVADVPARMTAPLVAMLLLLLGALDLPEAPRARAQSGRVLPGRLELELADPPREPCGAGLLPPESRRDSRPVGRHREGLEATSACRNGCIIVDDTRKPSGARPNPSQRLRDGPYVIRIVGTRSQANQRRDQPKRSKAKRPHAYPASFTSARA